LPRFLKSNFALVSPQHNNVLCRLRVAPFASIERFYSPNRSCPNGWRTGCITNKSRERISSMDSGTSRKRPWEEASPIDPLPKRRDTTALTVAAGQHRIPPLPQHAGHYPHDSQTKNQRRLPPPLYVPSSGASSDAVISGAIQLSTPAVYDWNISRPRSQSLFDIFNQPQQVRHDSKPGKSNFLFAVVSMPVSASIAVIRFTALLLTQHNSIRKLFNPRQY
jgi:hypothetical protein